MCNIDGGRRMMKKENSDRLSGLPEQLLVTILSSLPLKSAMATAVLSRQWRWLWTHISDIDIDINLIDLSDHNGTGELLTLVNNILPKLTSPFIRSFSLQLQLCRFKFDAAIYDYRDRNRGHIVSWFDWACRRNKQHHLEQFSFKIDLNGQPLQYVFPDPPLWVFQIPSLVVLELKPWLFLHEDYDNDKSLFHLPNLKKVSVELHSYDARVLEKLVSSSPSLEDLSFKTDLLDTVPDNSYHVVNLSSHSLKRLDMQFDGPIHVVINAPNLEHLSVHVNTSSIPLPTRISFVNSPTALLACSIIAGTLSPVDIFLPSNFFSVISGVISFTTLDQNPSPLLAPITFRRLTHLKFWVVSALSGLALLQQCPVLEVLTFDLTEYVILSDCSWSLPDSAPQCLVTCVKRIEILAHPSVPRLEDTLLQLLNYLLGSAKALELLRITINAPPPDLSRFNKGSYDELRLIKKLFEVPRSSPQSRVEFNSLHKPDPS